MDTIFVAKAARDGDIYVVSFPDAPGCYTMAANLPEAQNMAEEALALYWEGRPVPQPKDPDTRADEIVASGGVPLLIRLRTSAAV